MADPVRRPYVARRCAKLHRRAPCRAALPPQLRYANVKLTVLLSLQLFTERNHVSRIVAESHAGRFEVLPQRLDCIAALAPGILRYETRGGGAGYLAVAEGVLIKTGDLVLVSVRRAIEGVELEELQRARFTAAALPGNR